VWVYFIFNTHWIITNIFASLSSFLAVCLFSFRSVSFRPSVRLCWNLFRQRRSPPPPPPPGDPPDTQIPRYSDTISPSRALALVCIIAAIFSRFWILWLEFFFCLFGGAIKTSETFGLAGYYDSHGSNAICFCYGGRDNRDFSTFVQLNWEFCFIWLPSGGTLGS